MAEALVACSCKYGLLKSSAWVIHISEEFDAKPELCNIDYAGHIIR